MCPSARTAPAKAYATRGMHALRAAPAGCRRTCHAWHVRRTLRRVPGACAARGTYAARSAARLEHVLRVARTPHAPPPAWRTCHFSPHAPPLALLLCHAWLHAARAACVSRVAHGDNTSHHAWYMREKKRCHTWLGISNSCATRGRGSHTWRLTTCHLWHLSIRLMPRVVHFEKN